MPRIPAGLLVLLCGSMIIAGASAQTKSASLVAEVTDETGAIIVGAEVTLINLATGLQRTATTGPDGRCVLENIPPGLYDIKASMPGMQAAIVKGQQLFVGTTATLNFRLRVGEIAEHVTVSATAALVEPTESNIGQVIRRAEVDELPVLDLGQPQSAEPPRQIQVGFRLDF